MTHLLGWTAAGKFAEKSGIRTTGSIVCSGAAVCRHQAIILATILCEAGYNARVAKYVKPNEPEGHAWVEVDAMLPNGSLRTFILDPATNSYSGGITITLDTARQEAKSNPEGHFATYYANPQREFFLGN